MKVAFNDISAKYPYEDKYQALAEIQRGLEVLKYLRQCNPAFKLYAEDAIRYDEPAPGYFFNQIFHEDDKLFSRNNKTFLRTMFKNYNKIDRGRECFRFRDQESSQCAWAHKNKAVVFSFSSQQEFLKANIHGRYVSENGREEAASLNNLSQISHVDGYKEQLGIRIYDPSPKHKINYGWGSDMDLPDEEAQLVLNRAVPAGDEKKHLVAKHKGRYYSFRCHYDNCYHGYIDDTMPQNIKNKADREAGK